MASSEKIALIARAEEHGFRPAIISSEGTYNYRQLLERSRQIALTLLDGREDLKEERVAFLTPRGFDYAALQWGIWRAGGIAVPLGEMHPVSELEYLISDSAASMVVAHPEFEAKLRAIARNLSLPFVLTEELLSPSQGSLPKIDPARRAMILYTSGTTGKAKGVVSTHLNIQAQVKSLVEAWGWTSEDYILHVLPLHHVHGIINVLTCALWAGARCEILPRFDPLETWQKFVERDLTLFMAVPTIYVKLIAVWEGGTPQEQELMGKACQKFRLMVSGSAALPVSVLAEWKAITGHTILERYGMTEIGMALSNPLYGERAPGSVGTALPQVEVRLVDDGGNPVGPGVSGEIQVKGPSVFLEYWQRPEETRASFHQGWFSTGDVAIVEKGIYRILGRKSTDIIKTGGYKVSALEIEEVLRSHPAIKECAVVGIEDPEWGERVGAALILESGEDLTLAELRTWGKRRLAPYKVPTRVVIVDDLPRNPLGKVTKLLLKKYFEITQR
ncbi:MAG: acyl-CoA synthetase [Deltaproteobacteria bacterium]|nr:MAG: acyl-CoA synthetase [Deltaproteobacteria bacterium]